DGADAQTSDVPRDVGRLISVALVIKMTARRGSFLLVPHGPITNSNIKDQKSKLLSALLEKLKGLAGEEKADFIRVSPIWERVPENEKLFKNLGFRLRPLYTHPESSWKLNIAPHKEYLFSKMRKTTKYLIKQAQKNEDLEIYQTFDEKDIETFNKMHLEVVKTQKFIPFSLEYFKKEFAAFLPDPSNPSGQDNQIALFFAKYQGKVIAASYGIFWSNRAFYHHAALLPEYKKIPASYLLQWEAIKEAKKRGCKIYDFWGYSDPVKYPKHPYSGPTLFKMGFGGYKEEYVKTQDYVISQKYWINYIIETVRRIKRGL
ncbi:peptidoglycan bridge formation glycyltransferase FemA/FemB family protein, partial [Candidatus Parcubacteria bacterium]|nr:peptidoglycan bridge formation glycyltransferase FemA/FemB family protein [Candidatus Parcubacteria bacterium]